MLVVLDFDTLDGPGRVLGMTPQQLSVVTIVVRTSRGWHVYARGRADSGTPVEGLDVRADGGMVVAPPSIHASGHEYAFVGSHRGLVAFDAIAGELTPPPDSGSGAAAAGPASDARVMAAEAWVLLQAPKLQEAWRKLRGPVSASFDASRADFAVARSLWEAGWSEEEVVHVLLALPGSRARERGEPYARLTVARAFAARSVRGQRGR